MNKKSNLIDHFDEKYIDFVARMLLKLIENDYYCHFQYFE
jgi:hypothetical protein